MNEADRDEERAARERRHSTRLVVLAVLGAVVVALMFALIAPGLFG
ncbi:MAG TPA: hypothetical protein GXZ60_15920 [Intrasporangiaceae bacterium]|nr:hypothetical protein [Intrasporangiaceae bacterium]